MNFKNERFVIGMHCTGRLRLVTDVLHELLLYLFTVFNFSGLQINNERTDYCAD